MGLVAETFYRGMLSSADDDVLAGTCIDVEKSTVNHDVQRAAVVGLQRAACYTAIFPLKVCDLEASAATQTTDTSVRPVGG